MFLCTKCNHEYYFYLHKQAFTKLSNVPRAQADRIKKGDPAEYTNMVHPSRFPR